MNRVVIDTNVLVGSAYNERSASRAIVDAVLRGESTMIVSPAVCDEYRHIIPRAVRGGASARLDELIDRAEMVEPTETPRVVPDDPQDDVFLAAALAGRADVVVSNDEHLLRLGSYEGIPIERPADAADAMRQADRPDESDGADKSRC